MASVICGLQTYPLYPPAKSTNYVGGLGNHFQLLEIVSDDDISNDVQVYFWTLHDAYLASTADTTFLTDINNKCRCARFYTPEI